MQEEKKKKYEKPRLTKIRLDAKCAVLGFCKTNASIGPSALHCGGGSPCTSPGS